MIAAIARKEFIVASAVNGAGSKSCLVRAPCESGTRMPRLMKWWM
jgi:hypothetical protein